MRQFIRHPSDIPIKYNLGDVVTHTKDYLKDVSQGGLSFSSKISIDPGSTIHIKIPIGSPVFEVDGIVKWCRKINGHYEVGVSLVDAQTEFGVRMVEQVCHIEHYKKEVLEKEGRTISGEDAAIEWINKYAATFPR